MILTVCRLPQQTGLCRCESMKDIEESVSSGYVKI